MDNNASAQLKKKLLNERLEIISILEKRSEKDKAIAGNYIPKADDTGSSTEAEVLRFEELDQNNDVVQQMELRLKDIDRALDRSEKALYGICVKCKKEIAWERLAANPAAEECVDCLTV